MEAREHFKIYKKSKLFIIIFTVVLAVAAYVFARSQPTTYKVAVAVDLKLTNRPATADYQYGSYYDLKGAEIFTQHAMSWLMTPAVISEIYDQAGASYEIDDLDRFTSRFNTRQYSAQNFQITFSDYDSEQGEKIGQALGLVLEQKVAEAETDQAGDSLFAAEASAPVVVKQELNPWTSAMIGLIFGFVLSVVLVYLREYFRE